jgi:hypothetical protein
MHKNYQVIPAPRVSEHIVRQCICTFVGLSQAGVTGVYMPVKIPITQFPENLTARRDYPGTSAHSSAGEAESCHLIAKILQHELLRAQNILPERFYISGVVQT